MLIKVKWIITNFLKIILSIVTYQIFAVIFPENGNSREVCIPDMA